MRDDLKNLIELASIDLAFARAEIALAESMGDEKERIARHLDAAAKVLNKLAHGVAMKDSAPRVRRVAKARVA